MNTRGRIFAISDLHVDYKENHQFVKSWSHNEFQNDAVIVAGDLTDNLQLLETTLRNIKSKFSEVFYVPGNHELWIRPHENCRDSVMKHKKILQMCDRIRVNTKPGKFYISGNNHVWIVPLFSWYSTPEDDVTDTLYMTSPMLKEDAAKSDLFWMDNQMCKWPKMKTTRAKYFASMNEQAINKHFDGPVISFSHMVPRRDLIRPAVADTNCVNEERHRLGLGAAPKFQGGVEGFNFTRYAGANIIDTQLRKIGSSVHVYGHQHRNRDRVIDGVRYISHCLGNVKEQKEGYVWGVADWKGPKQIWPPQQDSEM